MPLNSETVAIACILRLRESGSGGNPCSTSALPHHRGSREEGSPHAQMGEEMEHVNSGWSNGNPLNQLRNWSKRSTSPQRVTGEEYLKEHHPCIPFRTAEGSPHIAGNEIERVV